MLFEKRQKSCSKFWDSNWSRMNEWELGWERMRYRWAEPGVHTPIQLNQWMREKSWKKNNKTHEKHKDWGKIREACSNSLGGGEGSMKWAEKPGRKGLTTGKLIHSLLVVQLHKGGQLSEKVLSSYVYTDNRKCH